MASIVRHIAASLALRSGSRLRRSALAPAKPDAFWARRGKIHFDRLMLKLGLSHNRLMQKNSVATAYWMDVPAVQRILFIRTHSL